MMTVVASIKAVNWLTISLTAIVSWQQIPPAAASATATRTPTFIAVRTNTAAGRAEAATAFAAIVPRAPDTVAVSPSQDRFAVAASAACLQQLQVRKTPGSRPSSTALMVAGRAVSAARRHPAVARAAASRLLSVLARGWSLLCIAVVAIRPSPLDCQLVLRLGLAAFLGMVLGLERRTSHRPAGVRTM